MSRSVLFGILGFAIDNGTLATNALRQIRAVRAQTVKTPVRERDTTRALTKDERNHVIPCADKLTLSETINPRTRRKRSRYGSDRRLNLPPPWLTER